MKAQHQPEYIQVGVTALRAPDGSFLPAQTVIISIGDIPSLPFLPESVQVVTVGGAAWIKTDSAGRTSDAKILAGLGYKVKEVTPVDMFPQTMHVETVALLTRKEK